MPFLCAALLTGCAGSVLTPRTLSPKHQAPLVENAQTIDLSKLAGFAVSNELIEPGDVLEVTIISGYSERWPLSAPVRVADNGAAGIPLVGDVAVGGFELDGAEQAIRAAAISRGIFLNPHVTVLMDRKRFSKITVVGAVNEPGVYEVPRSSGGLLGALVAAGGLADDAGTEVEIRSPARQRLSPPSGGGDLVAGQQAARPVSHTQPTLQPATSVRVDLVAATRSNGGSYPLRDGDLIHVSKRDPKPLHVLGLVNKPGQYEMPPNQDVRLLDAVALAGGLDSQVADKVFVIRKVPGQEEAILISGSLSRAKRNIVDNLRLAPGDVVSVEQTPATLALDAVKSFIRVGVSSRIPLF